MNSNQTVKDKDSDYVRIKKKRYMIKSMKLQQRMSDIRILFMKQLAILENKRKKISTLLDKKEEYEDIEQELHNKQKILELCRSNLQHAEDSYEYMKKDVFYSKILFFTYGATAAMIFVAVVRTILNH